MTVSACLIIIGNEILSGRTQDRNLAHIARRLNEAGVRLMEARVIPDIEAVIIETVNECRERFDYVFTTGGIGPTHDDITSAAIARAFGLPLVRHPGAMAALEAHYKGPDPINEARLKMADMPQGAELIPNEVSAAPGFRIANVHVMAGVPAIMQAMLETVLPTLKGDKPMQSLSLTTDLREGAIAGGLTEIQQRYPDVEIGSYPHFSAGELSTTLVFSSTVPARNQAACAETQAMISRLGGRIIEA
jgi:molybdenum cofactor synthesis domain-containing protein